MTFPVNNVMTKSYGPGLAIASNGTLAPQVLFMPGAPITVLAMRFHNGARTNIASGTAAASAATVAVYKNASNTGSYAATLNNNGTAIGSTVAGMKGVLGAAANRKLAADDLLLIEVLQGASSGSALAAGWMVDIDFVYGTAT
jgi:hypothetical protein